MTRFHIRSAGQALGPLDLAWGTHTVGSEPDATIRIPGLPDVAFQIAVGPNGATLLGKVPLIVGRLALAPGLSRFLRPREEVVLGRVVFALAPEPLPPPGRREVTRENFRAQLFANGVPRITWLTGLDLGKNACLMGAENVIGRGPGCHVRLRDRFASRAHACVQVRLGRASLVDLASANGVRVNGKRIRGETALVSGDVVEVGATLLGYDAPAFRPTPSMRPTRRVVPPPPPRETLLRSDAVTDPGSPPFHPSTPSSP